MRDQLINLFEEANDVFLRKDISLIKDNVNERGICGALALHLSQIKDATDFERYHVDVEYNRNQGEIKTIVRGDMKPIPINCDIILHSRGKIIAQDNLIAIEMKKSWANRIEKQNDKDRLIALTSDSFNNIWSNDGKTLPEHVCGYELGIYYEINKSTEKIYLEYYSKGELRETKYVDFPTEEK